MSPVQTAAPTILINEVGPRDGLQNQRVLVPMADKLRLIDALVRSGLRAIEVTSFVSPKAVPQMADADLLFRALAVQSALVAPSALAAHAAPAARRVAYSALVPNMRGLARAAAASVGEIAVVLSATETMNQRNIQMSLAQARAVCAQTLTAARQHGMRTKAYIAVAFECPFEGPVPPSQVLQMMRDMAAAGADELVVADTIGAAGPAQVMALFTTAVAQFGAQRVSAHFHDTRGLAVANAWAAIQAGVRKFDSSIGGLGGCPFAPGAAGNLATEDLVLLAQTCGFETGVSLAGLRSAMHLAQELTQTTLGGRCNAWLEMQEQRAASDARRRAHQLDDLPTLPVELV